MAPAKSSSKATTQAKTTTNTATRGRKQKAQIEEIVDEEPVIEKENEVEQQTQKLKNLVKVSNDDTNDEKNVTISDLNTKSGFVLAVGENISNQLGLGEDIDNRKKPQLVKQLPDDIIQIVAGGMHSACLTKNGQVYTWGCNDEFALGRDNNDEDIDKVELNEHIIQISGGDSHTAALGESGSVYAWGTFRDGNGVLGLEEKKIAKKPFKLKIDEKVIKISSGADHIVCLTEKGDVYTAGNSEHGQLGRVSKYNSHRGGRRGYDTLLLPGLVTFQKKREFNRATKIENIWTTSYCSFLKLKDSNVIIGFGLNNCYQLGIDDGENRYAPEYLTMLRFGADIVKIAGGMHHTLFLDNKGKVYSIGSHRYGCLGIGDIKEDVQKPLQIASLTDIVDISANTSVSYAINKYGKVFSWGSNYSKQLGHDNEDDYLQPERVSSKQIDCRDVYSVSVGGQHTLFIASDEKD
jgi:regulator of chromosome condensation